MLTVQCPKCRATMQVDEKYVGKRGRCTKCQEQFTLTAPAAPVGNPFGTAPNHAATTPPSAPLPPPTAPTRQPVTPAVNPFLQNEPAGIHASASNTDAGSSGLSFLAKAAAPTARTPEPATAPVPAPTATPVAPSGMFPSPTATRPPTPTPAPNPFASTWEESPAAPTPSAPAPFAPAADAAAFVPEPEPPPAFAPTAAVLAGTPSEPPPKLAPVILEVAAPPRAPAGEQRVARLEGRVVRYICKQDVTLANGALLRAGKTTNRLLVKAVGTQENLVGWGEAHPSPLLNGDSMEGALANLRRRLRGVVEGQSAYDFAGVRGRMDKAVAPRYAASGAVKSAIESACVDLWARTVEIPAAALASGGKPARAKQLASTATVDPDRLPADLGERLSAVGGEWLQIRLTPASPERLRAAVVACALAMPDGVRWIVDVETEMPVAAASRLASLAEDRGAYALRHSGGRTPGSAVEWLRAIAAGYVRSVEIRPTALGWCESLKLAAVAESAGLPVVVALEYEANVGVQFARHVAGVFSTAVPIVDAAMGLVEDPIFGAVGPNVEGLGLGAAVNEETLAGLTIETL